MIKILIPVKTGIYFLGFPIELGMRSWSEKLRVSSFKKAGNADLRSGESESFFSVESFRIPRENVSRWENF